MLTLFGEAARAVLRRPGRSGLSALGVSVAIAATVWVVALGQKSAAVYADLLAALGDNLVWVEAGSKSTQGVRGGAKTATSLTVADMDAILRDVALVRSASPQVDVTVQLVNAASNWTTRGRGIAPAYLQIKRFDLALGAGFGEADVTGARNVVVLGETVRGRLYGTANPVGEVLRLNGQPFEVVGVLAPKGQSATGQDQDDVAMLPYTTTIKKERPFGATWVDDIVCSAVSPGSVGQASADVSSLMRERHHIGVDQDDDFKIRHPEDVVNAQLDANATFSMLLRVLASVSLLVGGIGIMNVMLASVTERTREIGLRLAVGGTELAITLQFIVEAVILCAGGGTFGVALSYAGASVIGKVVGWDLPIPLVAIAVALGVSTVLGVVFGLLPARRAARLDPIDALRSD